MFLSVDNNPILFEEYKLTEDELNSCRKRLLTVEPYLCIAEEEGHSEHEDWDDVYYYIGEENKIICIIPNSYEVNIPQIFVLSDKGDYKMDEQGVFDFLMCIYEKKPGFKLSNMQFSLDDETPSHTGLIYNIAYYLTALPKEPEIYNSYDNYHSGVRVMPEPKKIDLDEVTRLIQVVLSTVYNYQEPYKLTSGDMKDLVTFSGLDTINFGS